MPLTDHAPNTLRMLLGCCLADPDGPYWQTPLAETLQASLADVTWSPTPDDLACLPEMQAWYDALQGDARILVHAVAEHNPDNCTQHTRKEPSL